MRVAVIGVGAMGRWFTRFFLDVGIPVIVSDIDMQRLLRIKEEFEVEIGDNEDAVKDADLVMLCVPVEHFESVVKEIHSYVRADQKVVDICTVKKFPVEVMHMYIKRGITLGAHPMFGPDVKSIKYQNVILTPTTSEEEMFARNFKSWLEKRQAKVYIMSPETHDMFMKVIFRLPKAAAFLVFHTNKRLPSVLSLVYHALAFI